MKLAKKHQRTLARIRANPKPGNLKFRDLEALLKALGFKKINTANGCKFLNGDFKISMHPPHPRPDDDKGCLTTVSLVIEEFLNHDECNRI